MTARELYELSMMRRRQGPGWTLGTMRRWLDKCVERGWLVKQGSRYYPTDNGRQIGNALAGEEMQLRFAKPGRALIASTRLRCAPPRELDIR